MHLTYNATYTLKVWYTVPALQSRVITEVNRLHQAAFVASTVMYITQARPGRNKGEPVKIQAATVRLVRDQVHNNHEPAHEM